MKKIFLAALILISSSGYSQLIRGSNAEIKSRLTFGTKTVTGINSVITNADDKLVTDRAVKTYADLKLDTFYREGNNIVGKKGNKTFLIPVTPAAADFLNGAGVKATTATTVKASGAVDNVVTFSNGNILSAPKNAINAADVVGNNALIAGAKDPYEYYILNAGAGITTIFVSSDWVANNDRRIKVVNYTGNSVTINFQNAKLAPDASNLNTTQGSYLTSFSLGIGKTVELIAVNGQANTSVRWLASGVTDNKIPSSSGGGALVPGGTTGYVLKKNSNSDFDYSWQPDIAGTGGVTTESDPSVPAFVKALSPSKPGEWDNKVDKVAGKVLTTYDFNDTYKTAIDGLGASLSAKLNANTAITPGSGTKLTVDSKGLVTGVTTATADDIAPSASRLYLTPAYKTVLDNTAGVNTGNDKTAITGLIKGSAGNQVAAVPGTDFSTPATVASQVKTSIDTLPSFTIQNGTGGKDLMFRNDDSTVTIRDFRDATGYTVVHDGNDGFHLNLTGTGTGTGGSSTPFSPADTLYNTSQDSSFNLKATGTAGASKPLFNLQSATPSTSTANGRMLATTIDGESLSRYMLYNDGSMAWSSGTSRDIYFSRVGASLLRLSSDRSSGAANLSITGKINVGATGAANADAAAQFNSTTGGILIPRMTQANRTAITTTSDGLLVYQTDATKGFYYYNATTGWQLLGAGGSTASGYSEALSDQFIHAVRQMGSTVRAQTLGLTPATAQAAGSMTSGSFRLTAVAVDTVATISSISIWLRTAGVYNAGTENRLGLYSYNGSTYTLIASTANDTALYKGTTSAYIKSNLTTPVTIQPGIYYVGTLYTSASQTTAPQLASGPTTVSASGFMNGLMTGYRWTGTVNSITTLPTTVSNSSLTSQNGPAYVLLND